MIKKILRIMLAMVMMTGAAQATVLDTIPETVTLFQNVKVFNGTENKLHDVDVLVVKNKIHKVASNIPTTGTWEIDVKTGDAKKVASPIGTIDGYTFTTFTEGKVAKKNVEVNVIDGGGRTLMPGLIESHVHLNMQHMVGGYDTFEDRDWQEVGAMAAFAAQSLLMDGFTTVRDVGALQAGIRRAIDNGNATGPRIYNAGAVISQTSGHGDWRLKGQNTLDSRYTGKVAQLGLAFVVDGYDASLSAARQNLANGASLNKMMLSGGVFSSKDGLHTIQGTDEEITAVVRASNDWGTYATAHVNNPSDIQRGLRLGLGEIMHGQFLDEETAAMMVEAGVFYSVQLSVSSLEAIERTFGPAPSVNKSKSLRVMEGMARIPDILLKYPKLLEKSTFGVDTVTVTPANAIRNRDHEIWFWADKFGNFQTLKSMTSIGGQLADLTGGQNPYPDGSLGVIEEGAYADILLIDGNPLEDITLIGGSKELFDAPDRKAGDIPAMDLIMKNGVIYKNTL